MRSYFSSKKTQVEIQIPHGKEEGYSRENDFKKTKPGRLASIPEDKVYDENTSSEQSRRDALGTFEMPGTPTKRGGPGGH